MEFPNRQWKLGTIWTENIVATSSPINKKCACQPGGHVRPCNRQLVKPTPDFITSFLWSGQPFWPQPSGEERWHVCLLQIAGLIVR